MREFRKRYWYEVALCASFIPLIYSPIAYTANSNDLNLGAPSEKESYELFDDEMSPQVAKVMATKKSDERKESSDGDVDTYTINFNNVSIIELIRFASKITNLNFVFEDADLQFSVTVVSEEPVTSKSVMAVVSQVLRMHNLILLEQDGNVMITTNNKVNQIPPIVSYDLPDSRAGNAAIVTRVFRIKNANISSIASIIRPMTSEGALIETSPETRQLIVTDITANVDQIASLLMSLDAPHTPLDVDTYVVRNISPEDLIALTQQILNPFSEGNPLIFVPQPETNSIYIVSTPYLIERAITVMEDLDIPAKSVVIGKPGIGGKNIFLYTTLYRSPQELMAELEQIRDQLLSAGGASSPLEISIKEVQEVKDTASLMFVADADTTLRLKEILASLDTPSVGKTSFYIYKIQIARESQLQDSLIQMRDRLKVAPRPDLDLIGAIDSMKWIKETNSLVFTGSDEALKKLAGILPTFDVAPYQARSGGTKSTFLIYNPENRTGEELVSELSDLAKNLHHSGLSDPSLLDALDSMKWVPSANTLLFTGDPASMEKIQQMLKAIDGREQVSGGSSTGFFLYKLQNAACDTVLDELKNIAAKMPPSSLQNENIISAINKIECILANNSLLITGTNDAIEQIKTLIAGFDQTQIGAGQTYLIYKPKYLPPQEIESALNSMAADLKASGLEDTALFQVIQSMRYIEQTGSLLFTGSEQGLDKVQNLLGTIDTSAALGAIQSIGGLTFFLYKIQEAAPDKLIASLKTFALDLQKSSGQDKRLAETINNVKWIRETNSLLFTGDAHSLERVEDLVKKFDVSSLGGMAPVERAASTFVIYNPRYIGGDELISILCDFMQNLMASGVSDPGLFDAINNLKWINKTSSLLISGDQSSVEKVQQLLQKFDVPGKENIVPSIESIDNTSFLVYKLQYHPGNDIQTALKQVATSLGKGSTSPAALVDAINSLQWVQITNSLLCTGQQDVLVKLKELIQNLDVPLRQVFIEVLVIETALTNAQNFGLMWGGQMQYFNKTVLQTGNFPLNQQAGSSTPTPAQSFPSTLQTISATGTPNNNSIPFSTGFDLGVIGDIIMHKGQSFISLGSLMNAIQSDFDSTVILNPKIITQDNRQSTVFVGQNVPYTGALVTNSASNTTQTANIEYRDVGVSLTITPILGEGDIVTMDIVHDISELLNQNNTTTTDQVTGIQTSHTHMETRVHVPNNHFVALSGMINDSKTHFRTGIPCLGGLPVIGAIFSENDRFAQKTNIIIFVRPQIVNTYQEYKAITEHQEWLYKDNARIPMLKEEFDEGIDMVKLPENE